MKRNLRPAAIAVAGFTVAAALVACSNDEADSATSYPDGDLRIIVPYDAGGASDLAARTLAGEMEDSLGVSIIVENRSGGAGSVGLAALADADADGYTLGYMPVEVVMLGEQGYDTDHTDYDYLGQIVSVPATIGVPAESPYETLEDLVVAATENPDSITVSNSGAGSIWHAATTLLNEETGAQFRPVPFDGGAPAVTAAIGGQVDAVVAGVSETAQAHADGQLRVLAILAEEPAEALPDVQTATDQGVDVAIGGWGMLGAPAGVPQEVIDVLGEAVEEAVASESYIDVIDSAGNIPLWRSPADATEFVEAEADIFATLLAE